MIFIFPNRFLSIQKSEQFAPFYFLFGGLNQKSAASPRAYERVDFFSQLLGHHDVGSHSSHN